MPFGAILIEGKKKTAMKLRYISMPIFVVLLGISVSASAEEACKLTVRNKTGSSIGRIDANGTIRNASGTAIGRFEKGVVRNKTGASIGRVDSNGTIRNRSGASIGRVDENGTLRGANGSQVGRIDVNGTVRGANGASSGRFDGYAPVCRPVAAAFLFFFEPLHRS